MAKDCIVKLTRLEAQKLWIFEHTKDGNRIIPDMIHRLNLIGGQFLLSTGAKLVRKPNGGSKPYRVYGYHYDGSDVREAVAQIGITV